MSATSEKVSSLTQPKIGHVYISGRIDAVRRFENRTFTRVVMPAPDPYSSPSSVEVESTSRLGDIGDDLKCNAILSGYRNDYKSLDKETGEYRTIRSARITLKVLEP